MNKDSDELMISPYCCPHDPLCAVHKPPHDGTYVRCTCEEAFGATRHKLSSPPPGCPLTTSLCPAFTNQISAPTLIAHSHEMLPASSFDEATGWT
jgi:hypothetical protein